MDYNSGIKGAYIPNAKRIFPLLKKLGIPNCQITGLFQSEWEITFGNWYRQGLEEGNEKGIEEGIYLGIQIKKGFFALQIPAILRVDWGLDEILNLLKKT